MKKFLSLISFLNIVVYAEQDDHYQRVVQTLQDVSNSEQQQILRQTMDDDIKKRMQIVATHFTSEFGKKITPQDAQRIVEVLKVVGDIAQGLKGLTTGSDEQKDKAEERIGLNITFLQLLLTPYLATKIDDGKDLGKEIQQILLNQVEFLISIIQEQRRMFEARQADDLTQFP